ncbi:MAG: nucleoside triphosphate pyrophosphohydrolase [Gammaproteobacteria bacterium]|nr:MAG: nucleoside triphosphate pyrophosphohydrolase [Gammaproteobacteria bacterium]
MQPIDINKLIKVIASLRDKENGCPWDLQQTHETLISMTFEEMTELADAVARGDSNNTCEELGDILFHLAFYARIAEENGDFTMQDVIDTTTEKMIRRHPHIFAGKVYSDQTEQKADWHRIKSEEKALTDQHQPYPQLSTLAKIDNLPTIAQSIVMQNQLADMGFDWFNAHDVFDKIDEELNEVKEELAQQSDKEKITEEYGDLLFAVLNLGRKLKLEPDMALRKANHKFYARSEAMIATAGDISTFTNLSMDDKERLWNNVKKKFL